MTTDWLYELDDFGETPFQRGLKSGNGGTALLILNEAEKQGKSEDDPSITVHEAAAAGMVGLVRAFLDMGADVNDVDVDGLALIHRAALNGSLDLVKLLINRGANVNIREQHSTGMTPLALARWMGYHEVAQFISHYGGWA